MANLKGKDADAADVYIAASGAGTDLDPLILQRMVTQGAAGLDPWLVDTGVVSVVGFSTVVIPTITVSAASGYSGGDIIGGKITLTGARRDAGSCVTLHSLFVRDLANQKADLTILLFKNDPTQATYTDNGAMPSLATNTTDSGKLVTKVDVATADYETVGSIAVAKLNGLGIVIPPGSTTSLYAVIVTTSTPTYATTSDLAIEFAFLRD